MNMLNMFIDLINPMSVIVTVMEMDFKGIAQNVLDLKRGVTKMYLDNRDEYNGLHKCECSGQNKRSGGNGGGGYGGGGYGSYGGGGYGGGGYGSYGGGGYG